jgi:hypothetical protein
MKLRLSSLSIIVALLDNAAAVAVDESTSPTRECYMASDCDSCIGNSDATILSMGGFCSLVSKLQ